MKGDFTRFTHDPVKHYTAVLKQQGRVDLDADWNEQVTILQHLRQIEACDVIGPCGAPKKTGGFEIGVIRENGQVSDLTLSPGHFYVDGILCRLEATPVPITDFPDESVQVATLRVDGRKFAPGQWVEISAEGKKPRLFRIGTVVKDGRKLVFDAALTEEGKLSSKARDLKIEEVPEAKAPQLRRIATYASQPHYLPLGFPPGETEEPRAISLIYLDVWQRHITAIEDPDVREVGLGGPDTTTRLQTVWQVKLEALTNGAEANCKEIPDWPPAASTGRLSARVIPTPAAEDPCLIAPEGGYRGLENRLYRVEINSSGDNPTFKWSRDNGAVVFRIQEFVSGEPKKVRLERLGRDQVLTLHTGNWVEVADDEAELRGQPGTLAQVDEVDEAERIVALTEDASQREGKGHPKIRRWDHQDETLTETDTKLTLENGAVKLQEEIWIKLENGVQIRFEKGGTYHTGDYWLIPARTATAAIEWPDDGAGNPLPQLPHGIHHHYCPLALLKPSETAVEVEDCRPVFPPITELIRLSYVGGDGQEVMPPTRELPKPLQVGVSYGTCPMEAALVKFRILSGGGTLAGVDLSTIIDSGSDDPETHTPFLIVPTDKGGVAECKWTLGDLEAGKSNYCQQAEALLLDAARKPIHLPVRFTANLSIASQVFYDDPCKNLKKVESGLEKQTIQDALTRLCNNYALYYVCGDGQEALLPHRTLPHPLEVRVQNGQWPEAGVPVIFEMQTPGGELTVIGESLSSDNELRAIAITDQNGRASCNWKLAEDLKKPSQQVKAFIDPKHLQDLQDLYVCFNASLSQEEAGIHITSVIVKDENDTELKNDARVRVDKLGEGLQIKCDHPIESQTVGQKPTCFVTVEFPLLFLLGARSLSFSVPSTSSGTGRGEGFVPSTPPGTGRGEGLVPSTEPGTARFASFNLLDMPFYSPQIIDADVTTAGTEISWKPLGSVFFWLQHLLLRLAQKEGKRRRDKELLAHLTLKGNFIWGPVSEVSGERKGEIFLDGEAFGEPTLPSGDRVRGGDFEMWFWLTPAPAPNIAVEPRTHLPFGTVTIGNSVDKQLVVTNSGTAVLKITKLTLLHGKNYSIKSPPTTPIELSPGKALALTLAFVPPDARTFSDRLLIESNDPDDHQHWITLTGLGKSPEVVLGVIEGTLEDPNHLKLPRTLVRLVDEENSFIDEQITKEDGSYRFEVQPAKYRVQVLGTTLTRDVEVKENETSAVLFKNVTFDFPVRGGFFFPAGEVTPTFLQPGLAIPTEAISEAPPRIEVQPTSIDFGSVRVRRSKEQRLTVRNAGTGPLSITAMKSDDPQFTVEEAVPITLQPGAEQALSVRFTPKQGGSQEATLTIKSNDPETPTLDVSLHGKATLT